MPIGPVRHRHDSRAARAGPARRPRRTWRVAADRAIRQPQVDAPAARRARTRAASASASRSSTVPLLPISPAVRSHSPTRCPSAACLAIVAADADLDVVGMRTEREHVDRLDRRGHRVQPKTSSAFSGLPCSARSEDPAATKAPVTSRPPAEREQVMRIVAMRADVHQAVGGHAVRHLPPVLRLQAGDRRIHRQQLVHQLAGPLHEHRRSRSRAASRPGPRRRRAADRRASIGSDAAACVSVAQHDRSGSPSCLRTAAGHRLGQHQVGLAPLEVPPQRLELRRGAAGGDDDRAGADRALRRSMTSTCFRAKRTFLTGECSKQRRPAPSGSGRQPEAGAIRIEREAVARSARPPPRRASCCASSCFGRQPRHVEPGLRRASNSRRRSRSSSPRAIEQRLARRRAGT